MNSATFQLNFLLTTSLLHCYVQQFGMSHIGTTQLHTATDLTRLYQESSYLRGRWGRPWREPSRKPRPPRDTNQPAPSQIKRSESSIPTWHYPIHGIPSGRTHEQKGTPHRVVRVLQQVGAVLGGEAVRLPPAVGRGRGRGRRHAGGGGEDAERRAGRRGGGGGG
jgi:hypothetical protein